MSEIVNITKAAELQGFQNNSAGMCTFILIISIALILIEKAPLWRRGFKK
ncbi:hypothetical protein ACI0FM_14360 [Paenochrobactrum sp. BZR 588]